MGVGMSASQATSQARQMIKILRKLMSSLAWSVSK